MKGAMLGLFFAPILAFAVDAQVTVSGVSSGGYFAHQFHVAHSSWVKGAGLLAAGPYHCAQDGLDDAFHRCMDVTNGAPDPRASQTEIRRQARTAGADDPRHLVGARIFILAGSQDRTVVRPVVDALASLYVLMGVQPKVVTDLAVGHAFPTLNYGNSCVEASRSPYISNCGRDVAGELLQHLLGPLQGRVKARNANLFRFNQALLGGIAAPTNVSLANFGYVFMPPECRRGGCRVHVAFHGCRQTTQDIGDAFVTRTGYNEWAQANRLVVVYPQAVKSLMLGNPRGCWDWWGYTGRSYHTKHAPQIAAVANMVRAFVAGQTELLSFQEE